LPALQAVVLTARHPAFTLVGRIFSLFSFGDVTKVAVLEMLLSALNRLVYRTLPLFWTITMQQRSWCTSCWPQTWSPNLDRLLAQTLLIPGELVPY